MIDLNDVLLAMSNIPVDDPIAEIWGRGLQGGYKIIEYTGELPITINANGDALLDYRIYGADGGVGEPTESGEPAGYKLPMTVGKNLYNVKNDIPGYFIYTDGNIWKASSSGTNFISEKIPVAPGKKYTLYYPLTMSGASLACAFYSESNKPLSVTNISVNFQPYEKIYSLVAPANAAYFRTSIKRYPDSEPIAMFVEHMHNDHVYIGENQLGEDEYASFSDQKIYRNVSGTLTPTDPPVPLPEIPTIDGTTIIDYDGTPKPSQMYVKYKGKG